MATQKLPKVLVISTGGTLAMEAKSDQKIALAELGPSKLKKKLVERVPELKALAQCEIQVLMNRDSAHVGPQEWSQIANLVHAEGHRYRGVVILHGTDTLAYTACALSFLLGHLNFPVVITGAQRPLAMLRTDARRNLISSVEVAARGLQPLCNQVLVCFHDRVFRGNRVRKTSALDFSAFQSPSFIEVARIGTEIQYELQAQMRWPGRGSVQAWGDQGRKSTGLKKPSNPHLQWNHRVLHLKVTPAFPSSVIQMCLGELDALVLEVFPSGTGPTHESEFLELLKAAREKEIPVVIVSAQGNPNRYEAGEAFLKLGGLWASDMTPECAYVKSLFLLASGLRGKRFSVAWRTNLAGETGQA